jgi:hypothetical protein
LRRSGGRQFLSPRDFCWGYKVVLERNEGQEERAADRQRRHKEAPQDVTTGIGMDSKKKNEKDDRKLKEEKEEREE